MPPEYHSLQRYKKICCRKAISFSLPRAGISQASYFADKKKAVASTSFFVIRLKTSAVLPDYLCWFLRQPSVITYFKTHQAGSATPLIHKPAVENLEIPVPSLEEQKTIVAIAHLSKREMELQLAIIEKKQSITQQLLMNKIK